MSLITPRTLSGFRDYLPDVMLAREKVLDTARRVYRSYGFTPIDTPACESLDVLLGKGGDESDKLVYRVQSARGDKVEMGLRFDLTVPFARFSAQYINQLGTPFKRYAMGPVWRGERPGQGRYREFWQCDFDTIGTTSNASDIETALVINDLFTAIGFDKFEIRINNRLLLNGVLNENGLGEKAIEILRAVDKLPKVGRALVRQELIGFRRDLAIKFVEGLQTLLGKTPIPENTAAIKVLHQAAVDALIPNLPSLGADHLRDELPDMLLRIMTAHWTKRIRQSPSKEPEIVSIRQRIQKEHGDLSLSLLDELIVVAKLHAYPQLDDQAADELVDRLAGVGLSRSQADTVLDFVSLTGTNSEVLRIVLERYGQNELVRKGIKHLQELFDVTGKVGVPEGRIKIDLSICRGLDYYTGTIYETFLTDLPGIGSVCSGGRYDNLASKYTKQVLPGVGASLGVDRLIAAMEEIKHPLLTGQTTPAEVLVVCFDAARMGDYQRIASVLRAVGVNVEVYPEAKKVGQQFAYAEKRGFKLVVIAGSTEFDAGVWKVKDLAKREEVTVPEAELAAKVKSLV